MAHLILNDPVGQPRRIDLDTEEITIGRLPGCDISIGIDGGMVSREHAKITRSEQGWSIEDPASRNHTYLNDVDIWGLGKQPLRQGSRIRICHFEFVFYDDTVAENRSSTVRFVDQAGITFESSVSLSNQEDLRQPGAIEKLSTLVEVSKALQCVLDVDEVLSRIIECLFRVFPRAERGVIGFLEGDNFVPRWWQLRHEKEHDDVKISQSIIRLVADEQRAIRINDASTEFPNAESVRGIGLRSVMCAPLVDAEGESFGVFQLDSTHDRGFSDGDLEVMAAISIQASMAITVSQLHQRVVAEQSLQKELEVALQVQQELLPSSTPEVPGYEFAAYYKAARLVGGDYYDFVEMPDGRIAVVLADVGGKGVPAAIYMANLAAETRSSLRRHQDPCLVVADLNQHFQSRFATFVLMMLDPSVGSVSIVNAGHRPPILQTADGEVTTVGDSIVGFPFSVFSECEFEEETINLAPGDTLVCFSDGIEDAQNAHREERFGIQRAREVIERSQRSAEDTVSELVDETIVFSEGAEQFDDICVVSIKRL